MLEVNFTPFPLIETERLLLRQVEMSDSNEVFFQRSDETILKYLDRAPAKSIDDASVFIHSITESQNRNESITWGIELKSEKKLIGTISFWRLVKEHYRTEIGYVLHTKYQGKGLMQEAMMKILEYGFKEMKLHSVEANVNPDNSASIKLLVRNGFVKEAYFKENYFFDGKFLDSVIYSLINPQSTK